MILPMALSKNVLALFPDDYNSARESFNSLSKSCPMVKDILSFPLQSQGNDLSLSTEIIWIGQRSAPNVLVLISATHGVEGFVGAAVQADLITRIQQGYLIPENTAILLVFALNPYGFAHCRRCDEKGIDLNRNFIDFNKLLPENKGYELLRQAIYLDDSHQRQKVFQAFQLEHGQTAFEIAISGGQYTDPQGPFYGGSTLSHGRTIIEKIIGTYQLDQRHLAVIDVHSGLGSYGHGEVISDHPVDSSGHKIANRWYGASVTSPAEGDSSSVEKIGLLDYCWHPLMTQRGCFVTLEFGSYRTQALFDVILNDHRCWKAGNQQDIIESAKAMKEHFCPADSYWRELVLIKARQVIQQAVDGLHYD
ncbi:MAG: M14 family metallopeptidase [Gammaproteobacteria bacterium]|nr:M14 family metallopeptidase [Gammaproteobacteria bacterium]MDH5734500.1 M14 family metallopeptidase [Gammaproteobacteria bacterium]